MRIIRVSLGAVAVAAAVVYLANTSYLAPVPNDAPTILAHRGFAQRFDEEGLDADTCTASRIRPPTHAFLENTIASMAASFAAGADTVEFDVQPTTDGRFAVFHDWTVDCRTEGHGVTRAKTLAELQRLDIGYGYTADGGKTFPFRGWGVGAMPSLDEVLARFPDRSFLINVKSDDPAEGTLLAQALAPLPPERRARLSVFSADKPAASLRARLPDLRVVTKTDAKACLLGYIAYGWSGAVPAACRSTIVFVPVNVAPWMWGWPYRFLERMRAAGSEVVVAGPYHGGPFGSGVDSPDDLARIPRPFDGGVLTNDLAAAAVALKGNARP